MKKIVSFLPAATEMVCALGLTDQLVGITEECNYPPAISNKPVVVRPALNLRDKSLREIDVAVTERLRNGESLYAVDEALLQKLAPDLIVTQNLCQVCAPSGNEVSQVLKSLSPKPEILWMSPKSLEGVFDNICELGKATGRVSEADRLVTDGRERLEKVRSKVAGLPNRPRVFCAEWVDPVYCAGHWMPEMIELAGGFDSLAKKGAYSVRIPWPRIVEWAPEVLVVMPCGFHLEEAVRQVEQLSQNPGWSDLPAVRQGAVYAVDASAYFARPGPRLVEGVELLAHLIHPDAFPWKGPRDACQRV